MTIGETSEHITENQFLSISKSEEDLRVMLIDVELDFPVKVEVVKNKGWIKKYETDNGFWEEFISQMQEEIQKKKEEL